MSETTEHLDDIVREYIDLINAQVGMYMDALGGFAGHVARVERQIHRVLGPTRRHGPKAREQVVVWASYEDPSRPDVIHNRILRADDYLSANARGGSNELQHARSVLVFLFTAWELEIRPRLARAAAVPLNEVTSDIMGDLRIVRHAVLHAKGVLAKEEHRRLKVLGGMFPAEQLIKPGYEEMHQIFVYMKRDCARLMTDWLKLPHEALDPSTLKDVAIQRINGKT